MDISAPGPITEQIVNLNVGGVKFATSLNTLSWIPDTFFTSLLSGRMQTIRDKNGSIFIDRDPDMFKIILNYLRTKQIDISNVNISSLKHEAQFFGLTPLIRRLTLCEELESSCCGSVYFQGIIPPPEPPIDVNEQKGRVSYMEPEGSQSTTKKDFFLNKNGSSTPRQCEHSKKTSNELNKFLKSELKDFAEKEVSNDSLKVRIIKTHTNTIVVGFSNFVSVYKDFNGWIPIWKSHKLKSTIKHVAINAKVNQNYTERLLAISFSDETIGLWIIDENSSKSAFKKGPFTIGASIDNLFFVGSQMVALSSVGKVGIWHSATQNWQVQDMAEISCYDTAGSSLLLGCTNGCLYYIDMQKFPLRMKDNDLLVTELYRDPSSECITAISVFLTPKTSFCGNWIEIAYGTSIGTVRVIVQHPETVGHGPQLFQTYSVHTSAVTKISLTTGHLISVCSEYNHVRSWVVTRFRGMISTQPGTMSLASFKILTLESTDESTDRQYIDPGPYGEQDSEQVFIQKLVPNASQVYVRLASNGDRLCTIESIDSSPITSFAVHESDGSSRIGNRPRRYLFCGSMNGSIQMWDLTTALDQYMMSKSLPTQTSAAVNQAGQSDVMKPTLALPTIKLPMGVSPGVAGPTPQELLELIDECDICCSSMTPTPCPTSHSSVSNLPLLFSNK